MLKKKNRLFMRKALMLIRYIFFSFVLRENKRLRMSSAVATGSEHKKIIISQFCEYSTLARESSLFFLPYILIKMFAHTRV
jgi:hypothetical protein